MQGFKEFIMRGNLIELAVAFVMGVAFKGVIDAFTNIVLSLISKVLGGPPNFDNFMPGGVPVGPFFTQVVTFVLVAAVIYFAIVQPVNKYRASKGEADPATEAELLTEIRDLLADRKA